MRGFFVTSFSWFFYCFVYFSACIPNLTYSANEKSSDVFLDKSSAEFVYEKEEKKTNPQKISLTLKAQQITGFIESTDFITNLSASFNYPIQDSLSFSATQVINRNYYIKTDEIDHTGLWIQDTSLSLNKTFQLVKDSSLAFGVSSSLPISYYSRLNKVYTVSSVFISASIKLLPLFEIEKLPAIKELNLFISPSFNYYFSEPVTPTIKKNKRGNTIKQSSGGNLLPQALFGIRNMGLTLKVLDKLSFSSSVGRWAIIPYKLPKNKISPYDDKYYRHFYSLSLSAKYQVFESLTLQLSYSHVDRIDKGGKIQAFEKLPIFDDQVSVWLVSASYSFSKNKDSSFNKSISYSR